MHDPENRTRITDEISSETSVVNRVRSVAKNVTASRAKTSGRNCNFQNKVGTDLQLSRQPHAAFDAPPGCEPARCGMTKVPARVGMALPPNG
jgi:hypothetical protein